MCILRNKKHQLYEIREKLRNGTIQNFTVFLIKSNCVYFEIPPHSGGLKFDEFLGCPMNPAKFNKNQTNFKVRKYFEASRLGNPGSWEDS